MINKSSPLLLIVGIWGIAISLSLLILLFNHFKIVKALHWILGWIIGVPYFLGVLFIALTSSFVTVAVVFTAITALISVVISGFGLFGLQIDIEVFKKSILYFTSLSTALTIAYSGDMLVLKLYGILLDDGKAKEVVKSFGVRVYKFIKFRRRVYEFSILLYVLILSQTPWKLKMTAPNNSDK